MLSKEERKARNREAVKKSCRKLKIMTLNHYGGKCVCCGEDRWEFLVIDHIYGNGAAHRKEFGITSGRQTYQWLKRNGFPSGYRVLCHNCNLSFGAFGYCPHQREGMEENSKG